MNVLLVVSLSEILFVDQLNETDIAIHKTSLLVSLKLISIQFIKTVFQEYKHF